MSADRERLSFLLHEVRSPVAALAAVGQALPGTTDSEARHRLVELVVGACQAIERLVRDATVTSVAVAPVDVVRVVQDVAAAASLTSSRPVRVSSEVSEAVVPVDPLRVRQALDNIVRNAIAVSPLDGEVVIEIVHTRESVQIAVSDAGPGIAEEDLDRIFAPGVRVDEATPGSGLGLAVARAIAEAHGGSLRVESTVGVGSTFTLQLPHR